MVKIVKKQNEEKALSKKRRWHNIAVCCYSILTALYAYLMAFTMRKFYLGWHSLDLGHNLQYVNALTGAEFVENCGGACNYTSSELYAMGWHTMQGANQQLLYVGFGFGLCMTMLLILAVRGKTVKW